MLWDGVFLAILPTPTYPPTPHTAPANCWRSRVAVFHLELEFGPGHQRIELGDPGHLLPRCFMYETDL